MIPTSEQTRYQINCNHKHEMKLSVKVPKKPRSKSQPAQNIIKNLPKNIPIRPKPINNNNNNDPLKRCATLDIINVDSLKISMEQFEQIQSNYNEELSAKIPDLNGNSKIYVCNNIEFKDTINSDYIVIKEIDKIKLKVGELSECQIDVKVHSHLSQRNLSVIKCFGWCENDKIFCILYEFAENGDLLEELNNLSNPFDPSWFHKARQEMKNIAQTLSYMHHKGWSHKDLTLENILVDKNFSFYLHDFALVEEFDNDHQPIINDYDDDTIDIIERETKSERITRHSSIWSGKIEHMSPENYDTFIGTLNVFDPFSNDIWGLGVIIMCCFSTEAFLWNAPDKKINSYKHTIKNLNDKLYNDAFKINQQKNKNIKNLLILLIDLLQKIFVEEQNRIDIDQVLKHEFFANIPEINKNKIDKNKKPCCESCVIL